MLVMAGASVWQACHKMQRRPFSLILSPHTFHMACQAWPAPAQVNTQMLQNMTGVVAMDRWMAAGDSWKCRANGNHFPSPLFRYSVPGLPAYQACIWILGS